MTLLTYKDLVGYFFLQKELHNELGDYINLCYIIRGRKFNKKDIHKAFLKLVSRDEYDWRERKELISYLHSLAKNDLSFLRSKI